MCEPPEIAISYQQSAISQYDHDPKLMAES
jgi:hypothetical protein